MLFQITQRCLNAFSLLHLITSCRQDKMASLLRLVVPVGLFCLLLFGPFLQVASRARVFRKIRLLQGSFVTNETIEGISVFVTCILLCNKHGQCNGIATQDPTQVRKGILMKNFLLSSLPIKSESKKRCS